MKKDNKFLKWLKRPHGVFLVLIYLLAIAAITASIVLVVIGNKGGSETLSSLSYGLFVLAAVLLGFIIYTTVIYAPIIKQKITDKLKSFPFTASIMENYGFKTAVFSIVSFGITVAFATVNLVSAIRYRLLWYGAIAVYYFVLVLFRGGVLLADRLCKKRFAENEKEYENSKLKIYLASGAFLVLVEFAMIAAVTQMMLSERPTESGTIMAIANAAFTFYKTAMAIYNFVKAKQFDNPVTQSLRNLNLADACMSVVSLTVLMISTFNSGDNINPAMNYVKPVVGFIACAVVIAIASVMILRANKKLKALKGESENER